MVVTKQGKRSVNGLQGRLRKGMINENRAEYERRVKNERDSCAGFRATGTITRSMRIKQWTGYARFVVGNGMIIILCRHVATRINFSI